MRCIEYIFGFTLTYIWSLEYCYNPATIVYIIDYENVYFYS